MYAELEVEDVPIEFQDAYPAVPVFTDIHSADGLRVTATACEDGFLKLTIVDEDKDEILKSWTRNFDGPLTCVTILKPSLCKDALFPAFLAEKINLPKRKTEESLSMVVGYSMGASKIFKNIKTTGLDFDENLSSSELCDCVTCICAADLNFNGRLTILLGTFSQELLAYTQLEEGGSWQLTWQKNFPAPILSIKYADLTGDGVKEIVVITSQDVQILQHDLETVKLTALHRLNLLADLVQS